MDAKQDIRYAPEDREDTDTLQNSERDSQQIHSPSGVSRKELHSIVRP